MWQFVLKFAYGHLWKHLSQNHLTRNYAFYFVWIPFGDVFVYGPRFCVWRRYVYVRGEIASTFFFNPLLWFYSYLFAKPHIKIFLLVDHRTWMFFPRVTAVSDHIKCPFKRFALFMYILFNTWSSRKLHSFSYLFSILLRKYHSNIHFPFLPKI